MYLNINCINIELNNIIKNSSKHNNKTILYALAAIELINIMKNTKKVIYEFIKIMEYLKNKVNCYIDFEFLEYVYKNNKNVTLCDNNIESSEFGLLGNKLSDAIYDNDIVFDELSFSTNKLFDHIDYMLKGDTFLLNTIINKNVLYIDDEYGEVNEPIIKISKKLFDMFDRDNDGYINASDVLYIMKIHKKHVLMLEHDFFDKISQLLITGNKIDFVQFFKIYYGS